MAGTQQPQKNKKTLKIVLGLFGCGLVVFVGFIILAVAATFIIPQVLQEQQAYQENILENEASANNEYETSPAPSFEPKPQAELSSTSQVSAATERQVIEEQAGVLRTAAFIYSDKYGYPRGFEDYVGIQPSSSLPAQKNVSLYNFGSLPGGCAVTQAAIDCDDDTFMHWNGVTFFYTDTTICATAVSASTGEKISICK